MMTHFQLMLRFLLLYSIIGTWYLVHDNRRDQLQQYASYQYRTTATAVAHCRMALVLAHTLCCVRTQSATCVASACCRVSRSFLVLASTSLFRRVARPLLDEREASPIPRSLSASPPPPGGILLIFPRVRHSMDVASSPVYHRLATH